MNGIHDLGGMHGLGAVEREPDEPVFHHEWERRALALTLAMGAGPRWNLDMTRYAREQMPPAAYLAGTYYEHWLFGLETLMAEQGFLTPAETAERERAILAGRAPVVEAKPVEGALRRPDVARMLGNPVGARMADPVPARFRAGDRVVARNIHPTGHTRLPRYARGKPGVVDRDHGVFIFADAHAMGRREPQHVYSVRFAARDLWGPAASPRDAVYVDLWDDHLDHA